MNAVWAALVLLVVVIGLRAASQRLAARKRQAFDRLAAELGLGSTEFNALGFAIAGGTTNGRPARPIADALTTAWGTRRELQGQWNGRRISIGAVPARRHRKAIAAHCQLPREIGLWAHPTRRPIDDPPEKTMVVRSGDPAFDATIRVAARDAAVAERLLARPAVRAALAELTSLEAAFVHRDWVYVVPYDDVLQDVSAVRRLLDQVTGMAAALDKALSER